MSRMLRTASAEMAATLGFISFAVDTGSSVGGDRAVGRGVTAPPTSGGDADMRRLASAAVAEAGDGAVVGG